MRTERYETEFGPIKEGPVLIKHEDYGEEFTGFLLMPHDDSRHYGMGRYWISSNDDRMTSGDHYPYEPTMPFGRSYVMESETTKIIDGWFYDPHNDCVIWKYVNGGHYSHTCGHQYKEYAEGYCKRCFDEASKNLVLSKRLFNILTSTISVRVRDKATDVQYEADITLRINGKQLDNVFTKIPAPPMGNFFDVRKGELSFSSNGVVYNENGKWDRSKRQVIKPTKLVKYFLDYVRMASGAKIHLDISGKPHPLCLNRYMEIMADNVRVNKTMNIEVSSDPKRVYETDTSDLSNGSLGSSCMRPESEYGCRHKAQFYNDRGLKIVYVLDRNRNLKARALLWEGCITDDGDEFVFMDRIYGTERAISEFKVFAHENGWAHKVNQTYDDATIVFPDGNKTEMFYFNAGRQFDWEDAPFMDTLKFYHIEKMRLNANVDWSFDYKLNETEHEENVYSCDRCGCEVNEEELYHVDGANACSDCSVCSDYLNDSIWYDDAVEVTGLGRFGTFTDWMPSDHCEIVRVDNGEVSGYCFTDDVSMCEYDKNYYWNKEVHYNNDLNMNIHEDNVDAAYEAEGWVLNDDGDWVEEEEATK